MPVDWPLPTPPAREIIRAGAQLALDPRPEMIAELDAASLSSETVRGALEDPVLAEGARQANLSSLLHWAAANVQNPGARVAPNLSAELLQASRDFIRHGLDDSVLETWRRGQNVAWASWMEICFGLTSDAHLLNEVLSLTARSIATFVDDTVAAVGDVMRRERAELTQGTHAERLATVTLLLEGAPVPRDRAESRLGYGLDGDHLAAIVWGGPRTTGDQLEQAAELLVQHTGAPRRLTVLAGSATLWLWLPTGNAPAMAALEAGLSPLQDVRVAVGRPRRHVDGFRQSHLEASSTQRMMARLATHRRVGRYADTQLVALLSNDLTGADAFVSDILGDLADASPDLLLTLRTYLQEQCNAARTTERLFTHRNTVIRRLERCDRLLPRPLAEDPASVAAALELWHWRGRPRGRD